jgi:phage head maturation protease
VSHNQRRQQRLAAPQAPVRRAKFEKPGEYTDKDREKVPAEDFGDPENRAYPIVIAEDVLDVAKLIGQADNPKAVKARIIAIAKKKKFPLPESWKEEERVETPVETRSATPDAVEQIAYAQVTRIDEGKREVTLTATSERMDSFKTRFDYEASKDAFKRWLPIGNIREMHQPKAVGTALDVAFDDSTRKIDLTLRVSGGAEDTWKKLLDGTLKGGSIGASNVVWEKPLVTRADEVSVPVAKRYDLVEFSLVDAPSNPDCRITAIRAAGIDHEVVAEDETSASPKGKVDLSALSPALAALYAEETRADAPAAIEDIPITSSPSPESPASASALFEKTSNEIARERKAAYDAKIARSERITAAGDIAIAAYPEWAPGVDPVKYASGKAALRGKAEAEEIRKIESELRQVSSAEEQRTPFGSTPGIGGWQTNAKAGPSQSAVQTVQPQNTGSVSLYDTENVNALGFGVPPAAQVSPTPQGDITLNPAHFHEGGHPSSDLQAANPVTDTTPNASLAPTPQPTTSVPSEEHVSMNHAATFLPGGHPEAFKPDSGTYDKDGDYDEGQDIKEALDGVNVVGTGTPKGTPPVNLPGTETPMRVDLPEETRAGARLSADTMAALHDLRDGHFSNITNTATLCGCEKCLDIIDRLTRILEMEEEQEEGHEEDEGELPEDEEYDDEDMDEERVQIAETQRQMTAVLQGFADIVQSLSESMTAFSSTQEKLSTQLADLTSSQSDQQRQLSAEVTRALHDQNQALDARLAMTTQHLERLAEVSLATKQVCDIIANQPATSLSGPVMYAHDKRIALGSENRRDESLDLSELSKELSPQAQLELAAAQIKRQQPVKFTSR